MFTSTQIHIHIGLHTVVSVFSIAKRVSLKRNKASFDKQESIAHHEKTGFQHNLPE